MHKHHTVHHTLFFGLTSAAILFFTFFIYYPVISEVEAKKVLVAPKKGYVSLLDGHFVYKKTEIIPKVITVMIDNHTDARPQSGISKARVVYEVPVEGEFTRYMAVFDASQKVPEVGPVRSARPYFLDWTLEYGQKALYMHSGGSPLALRLIPQLGINDANEFSFGRFYWRAKDMPAPHNLYTSSIKWSELEPTISTSSWTGWKFTNVKPMRNSQNGMTITYNKSYVISWKYNNKLGKYERFLNGNKDLDKDGSPRLAENILLQTVKMTTVDSEGRRDIVTTGQGSARVLSAGKMTVGTWKKTAGRTKFLNANGKEISLISGQTWVQVVPTGTLVEVSN